MPGGATDQKRGGVTITEEWRQLDWHAAPGLPAHRLRKKRKSGVTKVP
jgi:hypothetical protein